MYEKIKQFLRTSHHKVFKPKSPISQFRPEDEELMSDTKAAFLGKPTLVTSGILYLILTLLIVGLIWAYFGEIDQSTAAEGKVIPASEDKIIQSLDGGIISSLLVHEGEIVKQGQLLMQFDDKRYSSDYNTDYQNFLALSARVARLTAESEGKNQIKFPPIVQAEKPELVIRETKLFDSRKEALQVELSNLNDELNTITKEVNLYKPLLKSGASSEIEYLNMERNINAIKQQILEKQDKFNESVWSELNQGKGILASLEEKLISLKDKLERTKLYSPVYGMVKKIHTKTLGGVVNPGMDIMEIVPLSDSLLIEARVKPADIAFIQPGQKASVKITAYDYTIFGSLDGKVEFISPDVIEDNHSSGNGQIQNYFLVMIRTNKSYFTKDNHKLYIMPGMSAMVQITTGKKTIMTYLLKPLIKAKSEAMTER
jgi:adhesin transport system membrane fusion protein